LRAAAPLAIVGGLMNAEVAVCAKCWRKTSAFLRQTLRHCGHAWSLPLGRVTTMSLQNRNRLSREELRPLKYIRRSTLMPRGDKSSYTSKQKRKAEHIEEGYERRGISDREAARRAWATVNKETGGGKKSGSGRGKKENHSASRKGGRLGGASAARRPASARSKAAKKAAATRKRRKAGR
jgi:plasmid stabilization system protein ParE